MTNEEAIEILFNIRAHYASLTAGYPPHDCYGLGDMKCSDMCAALLKGIKLLKQEPKTGHWIEHPHEAGENWEYSKYECSECHVWTEDDSDFCPDCGAKMVEPQESEEL